MNFLPNYGALGMVLRGIPRLGMVTTCLPKARDGYHMSAYALGPNQQAQTWQPDLGDAFRASLKGPYVEPAITP